jgi:hypothetical protein
MRVRITRAMTGEVGGIALSRFKVGHTYDMAASLATYLMVSGWATAVAETGPAMGIPLDDLDSLSLAGKIRDSFEARRKGPKKR